MRDVIVIGDVHGDGDRLLYVLQCLGIVRDDTWAGGTTSLIMMGDILDGAERSDYKLRSKIGDIETLVLLHKLRDQASKVGGRVTFIAGNHEIMNLMGHFAYVHPEDMKKCGGPAGRASLMKQNGLVYNILSHWKLAHVENNTLFCHAGIHTSIAGSFSSRSDFDSLPLNMYPFLSEHRQYMTDNGRSSDKHALRQMLNRLGCISMVIGHNAVEKPGKTWDGMITMSDSMLSRAFGPSKLGYVICIRPNGSQEIIKIPFGPDLM